MGRSSRRPVTPSTRGILPMAKAPSLRKDWSKGTQRTRKLYPGGYPWSWRNVQERFVEMCSHRERPKVLSRVRCKSQARF